MMHYYALSKSWNDHHNASNNWLLFECLSDMFKEQNDLSQAYKYSRKAYDITKVEGKLNEHGIVLFSLLSITSKLNNKLYTAYFEEYCALHKKMVRSLVFMAFRWNLAERQMKKIKSYLNLKKIQIFCNYRKWSLTSIRNYPCCMQKKDTETALKFHDKIDTSTFSNLSKSEYLFQKYLLNKNKSSDKALLALESYMVIKDSLSNADKVNYSEILRRATKLKSKRIRLSF